MFNNEKLFDKFLKDLKSAKNRGVLKYVDVIRILNLKDIYLKIFLLFTWFSSIFGDSSEEVKKI